MIPPVLRLLATQPHLLADHAHAYGSLIGEELGKSASSWKIRVALVGCAVVLLALAAMLGGIALMFWAVTVPSSIQAPWALVVAPLVPAVVGVACLLGARKSPQDPFKEVKEQFAADMALWREASAS